MRKRSPIHTHTHTHTHTSGQNVPADTVHLFDGECT